MSFFHVIVRVLVTSIYVIVMVIGIGIVIVIVIVTAENHFVVVVGLSFVSRWNHSQKNWRFLGGASQ